MKQKNKTKVDGSIFIHITGMSQTKGLLEVLKDFAGGTSIHGLGFVVDRKKSLKTRFFWAIVFSSLIIYASIELRNSVLCKRFDKIWIKKCFYSVICMIFLTAWYSDPINSVTLVQPIKNVIFPAVTLCPENSSPDRWGPAIKVFDHLKVRCLDQK